MKQSEEELGKEILSQIERRNEETRALKKLLENINLEAKRKNSMNSKKKLK